MIVNIRRVGLGSKGAAVSDGSVELVERVLPVFVLAALRAHGVQRLAAGMECRSFGGQALEHLAFKIGSMQQALEYRSAVVILKAGKVIAQGFQREARPARVQPAVPAARVAVPVISKAEPEISAPILVHTAPLVGGNILRLRAK